MALTALQTALQNPAARRVYRAVLWAVQTLRHWTQDGTYPALYWAATARRVESCAEDGAALTECASKANLSSTPGGYWWDRSAGRVYVYPSASNVHQATITARVALHLANHPTEDPDGVPHAPRLTAGPAVRLEIPERFGLAPIRSSGRLAVANGDGALDYLAELVLERVEVDLGADG